MKSVSQQLPEPVRWHLRTDRCVRVSDRRLTFHRPICDDSVSRMDTVDWAGYSNRTRSNYHNLKLILSLKVRLCAVKSLQIKAGEKVLEERSWLHVLERWKTAICFQFVRCFGRLLISNKKVLQQTLERKHSKWAVA